MTTVNLMCEVCGPTFSAELVIPEHADPLEFTSACVAMHQTYVHPPSLPRLSFARHLVDMEATVRAHPERYAAVTHDVDGHPLPVIPTPTPPDPRLN